MKLIVAAAFFLSFTTLASSGAGEVKPPPSNTLNSSGAGEVQPPPKSI